MGSESSAPRPPPRPKRKIRKYVQLKCDVRDVHKVSWLVLCCEQTPHRNPPKHLQATKRALKGALKYNGSQFRTRGLSIDFNRVKAFINHLDGRAGYDEYDHGFCRLECELSDESDQGLIYGSRMMEKIRRWSDQRADEYVLYFSGESSHHGLGVANGIVPYDQFAHLIDEVFGRKQAQKAITIVLDTCFSGAATAAFRRYQHPWHTPHFHNTRGPLFYLLFSSQPNEYSAEDEDGGIYTRRYLSSCSQLATKRWMEYLVYGHWKQTNWITTFDDDGDYQTSGCFSWRRFRGANARHFDGMKRQFVVVHSEREVHKGLVDGPVWNDFLNNTNKALWDDSIVPYKIDYENINESYWPVIHRAIWEFNDKTPVRWNKITKGSSPTNFVTFKQWDEAYLRSEFIGKNPNGGEQWIKLAAKWSNLRPMDVMHEMMHALGFCHEFQRSDWKTHCKSNKQGIRKGAVPFGHYDYKSIMQYANNVATAFVAGNDEYARVTDKSTTFSQGDLAMLRRIYGPRKLTKNGKVTDLKKLEHNGDWHKACSSQCTATTCRCGACGKLPGGVNCGYKGMKGHYSCCMNEEKESYCNSVHSDFWHMACVDSRCTDKLCYCGSCGGGCTYEGSKGHWSCCNNEDFKAAYCPNSSFE